MARERTAFGSARSEQLLALLEERAMVLDRPSCCPRCGQPVAEKSVVFPVSTLSLAERLIWRELARVEGAIVPLARLYPYTASDNGLKIHIFYLRKKTNRTIRSVWGEGYVLEPVVEVADAASI